MKQKKCGSCGEFKPEAAFNRQSRTQDGLATVCRSCAQERARERHALDPSKQQRANARWKANNPEYATESARKAALKYRHTNIERVREQQRIYDARRRIKDKAGRDATTHRAREKRRKNPLYRFYERGCAAISKAIKTPTYKGRRKTWDAFDYSPNKLRAHLKARFTPGMNWQNYGHGQGMWELDHIKPIAAFDPNTNEPQTTIKEVFALKNMRPIWTVDNMRKSSHWGEYWTLKSHV